MLFNQFKPVKIFNMLNIFPPRKRFEKAEAEYVAAKMELHNKQELKEQLTEHLYTIIHQNEMRKARKLSELMKNLEMVTEDGTTPDLTLPELPPLTAFQPAEAIISPSTSKHLMQREQQFVESKKGNIIHEQENQSHNENKASSSNQSAESDAKLSAGQSNSQQDVKIVEKERMDNASVDKELPNSADTENDGNLNINAESCTNKTKSSDIHQSEHSSDKASHEVTNKANTTCVQSGSSIGVDKNSSGKIQQPSEGVGSTDISTKAKTAWDFDGSLR